MNARTLNLLRCAALCLAGALLARPGLAQVVEAPLWFHEGRPSAEAHQAVSLLGSAADEGLDPADYDAARLGQAVADAARAEPAWIAAAIEPVDGALTAAVQRYLGDLHFGRIDPRLIHENFSVPPQPPLDLAAILRAAVTEHRLPETVRSLAPPVTLYARLREALARYRALAGSAAWQESLPAIAKGKLEPGQDYAGVSVLARRLIALGDLASDAALPARYEGVLVDAVQAFQGRHGLASDGVIGKATLAQLNVAPAARVRQIEVTLERLRWTPLLQAPRMIVVNVPEFVLRAYEARSDGQVDVRLAMKVIVGKAVRDMRTPLFDEDMRYIEFSPYWNVPPSIARKETVPRLRRDPGYLAQQGFEFVRGDGRAVTTLTSENLDAVLRGEMRLRQRPGMKNALGDIKFSFPNNDHIYLHHTPALSLFQREQRDFSHGCIRVEDPVALAKFVLADMPEWTEERIRAAMDKGISSTLRLKEPLPVVIAYGTAMVKNGGKVYFFPDIYGYDRLLDEMLRSRRATGRTRR